MFRKMRRFKQELGKEECLKILSENKRGVLSLIGDNGYPYGVPMSYLYKDNCLYFHGAKQGHKLDAIRNNNKASFTIVCKDYTEGWIEHFNSVICFGQVDIIEEKEECLRICKDIALHFTDDLDYINDELDNGISRVTCLKFNIEHVSGKHIKES